MNSANVEAGWFAGVVRPRAGDGGTKGTMKVLLIQHENHARRLFNHLLDGLGCIVVQTSSFGSASSEFRRGPFDLVFVDEPLPGMKPAEITQRLRRNPATSDATLVALVSRSAESHPSTIVSAGVDDYLALPAPLEEVQLRLAIIVGLTRKIHQRPSASAQGSVEVDRFFENMPDAAFVLDRVGTVVAVNQPLADLTGYSIDALVGQPAEFIGLPMAEEIPQLLEKSASSAGETEEITLVRRDMKTVPASVRYAWLDPDVRSIVIGVVRESPGFGEQTEVASLPGPDQVSFEFDRRGIIRAISPELADQLGTSRDRIVGGSVKDLVHRDDLGNIPRIMAPTGATESNSATGELRLRTKDGDWLSLSMRGHESSTGGGSQRFVLSVGQFGQSVRLNATRRPVHGVDRLTGLPDRGGFVRELDRAAQAMPSNGLIVVVLLNIDRFKLVNDKYGYDAGDQVLIELGRRLESLLSFADVLARIGGDEFAIYAGSASSHAEAVQFAERIVSDLSTRPFNVEGNHIYLTPSIGIAIGESGQVALLELLRQADGAAVHAKQSGRGRVHIYEPARESAHSDRLHLEQDLMQALQRDELTVYYQPEVDLTTGAIVGVEALVRWNHPDEGLIVPSRFIPTAESSGLLDPICLWVLEHAVKQTSGWISKFNLPTFNVSVNFSAEQFETQRLVTDISAALRRAGLPPGALRIEITESVLVDEKPEIVERMAQLRRLGVNLAIDDFGTGYASFSYLRSLPINMLKVDRTFVSGSGATSGELSLTRSIATLAREEGLEVVVEGIESARQLTRVLDYGCERGQGYYFSRAVAPETIEFLLMAGPYPFANLIRPVSATQVPASSAAAS